MALTHLDRSEGSGWVAAKARANLLLFVSHRVVFGEASANNLPLPQRSTPTMMERRRSSVAKPTNETLQEKKEELKAKFFASLIAAPLSIPPDFDDNDKYSPDEDGQKHDLENIDELLTKREQDYFNDAQFYCHLRARQWNMQKSLDMIRETLRWRREAKPWTISCDEIEQHFRTGKNYHNGWTKQHRPCVVMRVRLDQPGDDVGKIKTILYQMERSLRLIKARCRENDVRLFFRAKPQNLALLEFLTEYSSQDWKANLPASLLDTPPHEQVAWIFDCRRFAKKDYNLTLSKVSTPFPGLEGRGYLVAERRMNVTTVRIRNNLCKPVGIGKST